MNEINIYRVLNRDFILENKEILLTDNELVQLLCDTYDLGKAHGSYEKINEIKNIFGL